MFNLFPALEWLLFAIWGYYNYFTVLKVYCSAEVGATTSLFPYTPAMSRYLRATHRAKIASVADSYSHQLKADEDAKYDEVIEIDLSKIEPSINGKKSYLHLF